MSQLTVRIPDADVVEARRRRAAAHGRFAEAGSKPVQVILCV